MCLQSGPRATKNNTMASSTAAGQELDSGVDAIDVLLAESAQPDLDSYSCMLLPPRLHEPSSVRRRFLALSLRVHPDRNQGGRVADATKAFQKLSAAFETLYDRESQERHLEELRLRTQREEEDAARGKAAPGDGGKQKKRPKGKDDWKERAREKRKRKREEGGGGFWSQRRSYTAVVEEMRRRERMERDFVRAMSDERSERRARGLAWRAMRICRTLDERAGCPASFVNGLWAPLYEQEVRTERPPPEGWEVRRAQDPSSADDDPGFVYRRVSTGEEQPDHPTPEVERLLEKARTAELTNKFRLSSEPRLFLDEIIEYLRDDHDYHDMDDDIAELEEEERARDDGGSRRKKEYDF